MLTQITHKLPYLRKGDSPKLSILAEFYKTLHLILVRLWVEKQQRSKCHPALF